MDYILIFQSMIILCISAVALELFVGIQTGFDLVLLGSILLLGGVAGFLTGSLPLTLIVSSVLAVAYIAYGRNTIRQKVLVITHHTNIDKLIGKKGMVIRSITPDTAGMVRIDDEDWRATASQTLFEKDKIQVEAIEGVSLVVKKIIK